MPSHSPIVNGYQRSRPWKARVKVDWIEQFLGYFASKEEALAVEREFRAASDW